MGTSHVYAYASVNIQILTLRYWLDVPRCDAIHGSATKLKGPEGIALSADGDNLYVVNSKADSLEMFTDVPAITDGGNISPTLIIQSIHSKLNLLVGVALPAFTPTPMETVSGLGAQ